MLDDELELTLAELCRRCQLSAERVMELVDYGVIDASGPEPTRWRFSAVTIVRVQRAQRLQRDLGVNLAGAALALELLDEMQQLRAQLRRLEP